MGRPRRRRRHFGRGLRARSLCVAHPLDDADEWRGALEEAGLKLQGPIRRLTLWDVCGVAEKERHKLMASEIRRDPVCGMEIGPKEAAGKSQFGEWLYLFCSARCKEDFDENPVKYLLKKRPPEV